MPLRKRQEIQEVLRKVALLSSGVLAVFCFPSFNQSYLAWGCFVPLLIGVSSLQPRSAVLWGGIAGFLFNLATLYWVYPTCRWGGVPAAPAGLALVLLSLFLALYWAFFSGGARVWLAKPNGATPFLLAALWTGLEFARAHFLTGFPWLPLSASQWQNPSHLSLAEWGGAYAVSFLIMLFNAVLVLALRAAWTRRLSSWRSVVPGALGLLLLFGASAMLWRRPQAATGSPLAVAVVQGNIDQYKKWDAAYENEIVEVYGRLTNEAAALNSIGLILWPETAVPGWVPNDEKYTRWVSSVAKTSGVPLLVGAVSRQGGKDYNAAFLFSKEGDIAGHYRKQHLVPFGEFVPFHRALGKVVNVLNALGGFEGGEEASVLHGPVPLGVTICFEGLFPSLVRRFPLNGAEVLVNITNDGWYRHTAAPEQHLAANVLRAVENRRWLVRAANTGISAVIDPRGRVVEKSGLLKETVLRGRVVPRTDLTLYTRWGDWFAWACLLGSLGGLLYRQSSGAIALEKKTVEAMIRIHCRSKHGPNLCTECSKLLVYAHARLDHCRFGEGKPTCAKCPVHCYAPAQRALIRDVMREAGPAMAWRHPGLSLRHIWKEIFDKIP